MAIPQLSFKRLEIFCLVVETGGVTRAAESLLVAQPAVSAQIRSLEEWFGAPLFTRNAGRLRTTEAGDRAYEWAKQTLSRGTSVRRDVQELAIGGAGRLVVVASLGIGTYVVAPLLAALRAERPGVDIVLHTAEPGQALLMVENGEAHMAIITWHEQVIPTTLSVEHLASHSMRLIASAEGPPAGTTVTTAELGMLPFVGVPTDVAYNQEIDSQCEARESSMV
ncbi:LysR family transcriptional regulator [Streptomyces sp. NEAU-174]|uniref:LysR family transcriptional regulator n=1 Tax=Streptomyces sp. NEAU-174 TaxID=3458254 RepID=UPI004044EEB7